MVRLTTQARDMKFAVLGAGQMGSGIAQVAAQIAKIPKVYLYDTNAEQLRRQRTKFSEYLRKATEKGKIGAVDLEKLLYLLLENSPLFQKNFCIAFR